MKAIFKPSLTKRLVYVMLFLNAAMIAVLLFFYSYTEQDLYNEMEKEASDLIKAIQLGVEEITATGATDEDRLAKYVKNQTSKGINEISIIKKGSEVVETRTPEKSKSKLTHRKKDLIIKAELGEPVSKVGSTYNVILPVIANNVQYGYVHLKINRDDFSRIVRENAAKRVAATIAVFTIGILMAIALSRRYTRPIKKVVDAAKRIALGDLDQNIPVRGSDEIATLAQNFNAMVEKLRAHRLLEMRLRETEHMTVLGQLARTIAHEIRNPLNFINLSVDHIKTKHKETDPQMQDKFNELIDGIKQEIQRLNNLVRDVLDYGRPIRLTKQHVNVDTLVEEVMSLVSTRAQMYDIDMVKHYGAGTAVAIDPDLFKSCILNVVTNAFQALEEKDLATYQGVLSVSTVINDSTLTVSITDNGKGIPEEMVDKVFEPFFTTKSDGLGIGLPMTKRVIEEHGGSVAFKRHEDLTEVTIRIPMRDNGKFTGN